jgi:hypothetical protein
MYAKELTPKFADEKKYAVDAWIERTVSSTKKIENRRLGKKQNAETLRVRIRRNRGGTLQNSKRPSNRFLKYYTSCKKKSVGDRI